jgi:hypothetical protein
MERVCEAGAEPKPTGTVFTASRGINTQSCWLFIKPTMFVFLLKRTAKKAELRPR